MIEYYEERNGFAEFQRLRYLDKGTRVYRFPELHKLDAVIEKAREDWRKASKDYIKKLGDGGSAVLGNGLYVAVKPPRARSAFKLCIAYPMGQAEGAGWATKEPIMAYLKKNGIECWYECGRMD